MEVDHSNSCSIALSIAAACVTGKVSERASERETATVKLCDVALWSDMVSHLVALRPVAVVINTRGI